MSAKRQKAKIAIVKVVVRPLSGGGYIFLDWEGDERAIEETNDLRAYVWSDIVARWDWESEMVITASRVEEE